MNGFRRIDTLDENVFESSQIQPSITQWKIDAKNEAQRYTFDVPPGHKIITKIIKEDVQSDILIPFENAKARKEPLELEWQNMRNFDDRRTFSGTDVYDKMKLHQIIFDQKKQMNSLEAQNEILATKIGNLLEILMRKDGEVMRSKADKLSLIPFAISTFVCLIAFVFSLSLHIVWRLTGSNIISPETSYLLGLVSFGLLATSVTGLYHRGKNGIGTN